VLGDGVPDVALVCEGVGGIWLVSNEGCAPGVVSLISVMNASGAAGLTKVKRLMQAKKDVSGDSERDHLVRAMFRLPEGCEVWTVPKVGPIKRSEPAARRDSQAECSGAVESVLVG